jgi:STAS-like domain of unknown function (DUF4325)
MTPTVYISQFDDLITRKGGATVRNAIEEAWNRADTIVVDFGNKRIASISFMDEAFGKLVRNHDREELLAKFRPIRIRPFDKVLLNDVVSLRLKQRSETSRAVGKKRAVRSRSVKARGSRGPVIRKK